MDLTKEVKRIYKKNFKSGKGYSYTCPSLPKYPYQWLWDSCFHSIVLSKLNPKRAIAEIETLLSAQKSNGFIPHIIKWPSGSTSNLTQLPVVALAIEEVYKNTRNEAFLERNLPKVSKYFSWLKKERGAGESGLVYIIHPWESTDASPTLVKSDNPIIGYIELYKDLIFKDFKKIDITFNCLYAQGLRCLAHMSKDPGYNRLASKVEKSVLNIPFDGTAGSLLPIIFDEIPERKVKEIVDHLKNEKEFNLEYPIPFVAKNNPHFNQNYNGLLWRGPTWININWLMVRGLYKHGYKDLAKSISRKTKDMVDKFGFWEFYNPITGKGQGQKDYGWSGLVLDLASY